MEKRPELPPHFARKNDRGLIELIDINTGRLLCIQATTEDILSYKWDNLTCIHTPEGPVWIEKSINFDILPTLSRQPYSQILGDLLCQHVIEGHTLVKACKLLQLEYATVQRWKRDNEKFRDQLLEAKRDRAEALHDEVIETARTKAKPKEHIQALQWAAQAANPEAFGNKTKIIGDKDQPVQFILSTGIQRELPPAPKEAPRPESPLLTPGETKEIAEYEG